MAYEITGRHQDCLLNSLYRQTSNRNQSSTLLVFCENSLNSSVTGGFPNQRASSAKKMFIMSISPVTYRVTSLAPRAILQRTWVNRSHKTTRESSNIPRQNKTQQKHVDILWDILHNHWKQGVHAVPTLWWLVAFPVFVIKMMCYATSDEKLSLGQVKILRETVL